jgi:hypothetical protein
MFIGYLMGALCVMIGSEIVLLFAQLRFTNADQILPRAIPGALVAVMVPLQIYQLATLIRARHLWSYDPNAPLYQSIPMRPHSSVGARPMYRAHLAREEKKYKT